ncbi:hypothetical protein [Actinomyces procaprae]|uniref:hypothetical protein n=1 Tax=Actinomyces procaprae TaxID=2560010 RepID=UPI00109E3467|nr:hypothetical protein [Actinomyces procaprae]
MPVDFDDDSFSGFGSLSDYSSWDVNVPDGSGMVDNLKKQAIEKLRARAESAQSVLAVNPSTSPLAGAMRADGGVSSSSCSVSPAGGLSAFSGGLSEVWSSPLADDFGTDIDSTVTAVRDVVDDIYAKANNAWWGEEDRVPKGSDEAKSKWR